MSLLKLRSSVKSASGKPAKKSRLAVEQLEDRVVPTITFAQYGNGTFAYNSGTNQFRQITTAQAKSMDEGADGTLFASYNSGTWKYNWSSNVWTKLTTAQSTELSAANDNTLFASYSSGTWEYDATGWHKMSSAVATQLAAVGDNSFYGDYSGGLYKYKEGAWRNLTSARTTGAMDASSDGTLFVSYNSGTWRYREADSGWTKMTTAIASDIATVNSRQFYATYASGTWRVNDANWIKLSSSKATQIGADNSSFVGNFSDGTWQYQNGWLKISGAQASLVA